MCKKSGGGVVKFNEREYKNKYHALIYANNARHHACHFILIQILNFIMQHTFIYDEYVYYIDSITAPRIVRDGTE